MTLPVSWTYKTIFCISLALGVVGCGSGSGSGSGSGNGTALVSWKPPTRNSDGTAITDLAGYRVYYGSSPDSYDNSITIPNPGITEYLVEGLPAADIYFVMTAYNSAGIESAYSAEVYKRVNSN